MANLPSTLPVTPVSIADYSPILSTHVRNLWEEVIELAKIIGGSTYSNPVTITDSAYVSTPTNVGTILDAMSYILKNITGQSSWNTAPTQSIEDLITRIAALEADGLYILYGLNAAKPAANSVADGTIYFSTDTKVMYYSDTTNWIVVTYSYNPVGNIHNALLKYNSTTKQFESIPLPTQDGQNLRAVWNSGTSSYDYVWRTEGIGYLISQNITRYRPSDDTFVPYSTIAQACSASSNGDIILIPAGNYVETSEIVIPTNVQLVELQPDSVTITGRITMYGGSLLRIYKLIGVAKVNEHNYSIKFFADSVSYTNTVCQVKYIEATSTCSTLYSHTTFLSKVIVGVNADIICTSVINNQTNTTNQVVNLYKLDNTSFSTGGVLTIRISSGELKASSLCYIGDFNSMYAATATINIYAGSLKLTCPNCASIKLRGTLGIVNYYIDYLYFSETNSYTALFEYCNFYVKKFEIAYHNYPALFFQCPIINIGVLTLVKRNYYNAGLGMGSFGLSYFYRCANVVIDTLIITPIGAVNTVNSPILFDACNVTINQLTWTAENISSGTLKTLMWAPAGETYYFYSCNYINMLTNYILASGGAGGTIYIGNVAVQITDIWPANVYNPTANVKLLNSSRFAGSDFASVISYQARSFL